jgi:hypothetical protein
VALGLPPLEPVELGDQREEAVGGSVQVGRQRGDLVTEIKESVQLVVTLQLAGTLNPFGDLRSIGASRVIRAVPGSSLGGGGPVCGRAVRV